MKHSVLITAGPTREPIDAVRFIGNRSSGKMGAAIAEAALETTHHVTLIVGPVGIAMPAGVRRIDVETAAQMHDAVMREFPNHNLLIMAAAVADYRPGTIHRGKLPRDGALTIECEPTTDIIAAAGALKRPDQRTVGFSLEVGGTIDRAREKLARKQLDLIVYNPAETMESDMVEATLLFSSGKMVALPRQPKPDFARKLIAQAIALHTS